MLQISEDALRLEHFGKPVPVFALDVETTMRSPGKFSADPFYPDNELIIGQLGPQFDPVYPPTIDTPIAVYGVNVKFDLHYMRKHFPDSYHNIVAAYDLQIMYQLLTGKPWATLNEIAAYCGRGQKRTTLEDIIEEGGTTEDVDIEDLKEYLDQDVSLTQKCFHDMWLVLTREQKRLLNLLARTTMALAEMEWNGLVVDKQRLRDKTKKIRDEIEKLDSVIGEHRPVGMGPRFKVVRKNWPSNKAINQWYFGHPIKYKSQEEVGVYKNGNTKYKTVEKESGFMSWHDLNLVEKLVGKPNPNLGFSLSEKNIQKILANVPTITKEERILFEAILKKRKLEKILGTYLEPLGEQLRINKTDTIHGTYNQAATATGRLSSSNPNLQNMPPEVEDIFVNRFNSEYGRFAPDFKQLEVCGAAHVSGDLNLLADLKNGVDMHSEVSKTLGLPPEMRRTVKGVVFGTIYGGGKKTLSEQSGITPKQVGDIQDALFDRYPTLLKYYKDFHKDLKAHNGVEITGSEWTNGKKQHTLKYTSETGRTYFYKEFESPFPPHKMEASWTHACNYRGQGWATGDIVPVYLGLLWMFQKYYDNKGYMTDFVLNNTVHDSIYGDGNFYENSLSNNNVRVAFNTILDHILPEIYKEWTGREIEVPLTLDFETKYPKEDT